MKPDAAGLSAAIEAIKASEPVIIPTDTVYGLAVLAGDAGGLDRIFALKRRPVERSIAVLVGDIDQATEFAALNKFERRVAGQCWPGALTLVLNRLATADPSIGREDGTVGVRCPNNAFVRMLALAVGPLATTSANISGEPTPSEADEAARSLDGAIAVAIDGGRCEGQASTVARIDHDGDVMVLREGEYSQRELEKIARRGR
jgi:L-threonylcarbamoyladenylate synthase